MDSNKNLRAYFTKTYSLSASSSPGSGGAVVPTGGTFDEGTKVTLTASPAQYYRFNGWAGDASGTSDHLTIVMDSNKQITASFVKLTYTLQAQPDPPNGGTIGPGSGTYEAASQRTITATPAVGYRFDHWEGSITGSSAAVPLVMDGDKTVIAHFTRVFTLAVSSAPLNGGTVNPPSRTYDEEQTVILVATPSKDYWFKGWGGDSSGSSDQLTVTMNSNKTIVASFAKITYSLQSAVDPSGGGTVEPAGGIYEVGTEVKVTAIPSPGYRFGHWAGSMSGTSNPISVPMDANKNLTATFIKVYSLTVAPSPDGSASINPTQGVYDAGTKVPLVAAALFPYAFSRWVGTDNDNSLATTVTMNSDKQVVVYFTKLNPGGAQTKGGMYTGREVRLPITLSAGQWVKGGFISDSNVNVPFRILDPAFGIVQHLGYTRNASFTFQAQANGDYYVDIPYTFAFATSNYTVTYTIYS